MANPYGGLSPGVVSDVILVALNTYDPIPIGGRQQLSTQGAMSWRAARALMENTGRSSNILLVRLNWTAIPNLRGGWGILFWILARRHWHDFGENKARL